MHNATTFQLDVVSVIELESESAAKKAVCQKRSVLKKIAQGEISEDQ